jgi:hypothetical protein
MSGLPFLTPINVYNNGYTHGTSPEEMGRDGFDIDETFEDFGAP